MFNVFSDYLEPLKKAGIVELTERSKPSEVFNQLCIAYNQGAKGIEDCIRMFVPNPENEDELVEYIHQNVELMRVVRWTNKNITIRLTKISYKTLGVHLRIICSMLIKLKEHDKLKESVYYTLHSNLTKNAIKAHYEISTEELPF